jgi:hypothetical protein
VCVYFKKKVLRLQFGKFGRREDACEMRIVLAGDLPFQDAVLTLTSERFSLVETSKAWGWIGVAKVYSVVLCNGRRRGSAHELLKPRIWCRSHGNERCNPAKQVLSAILFGYCHHPSCVEQNWR